MHQIVDAARQAQVSAIIASDMATILYARSIGVEVHISTQVNVSNSEAVRHYAQWADVMVMARELNLDQVRHIADVIDRDHITGPHGQPVRIEMFCHGALCMAVSGKCYLSLHETGASANRGACRQICRRGYIVTDRETGDELAIDNQYIMSPKDLKTIHFINKVLDAGVRVLKIEGRARGPERSTPSSTAPMMTRKSRNGTSGLLRCSTVASGTATTWVSGWASGRTSMAPARPMSKSTVPRPSATSATWAWPNS